jgi:gas vesicle protein
MMGTTAITPVSVAGLAVESLAAIGIAVVALVGAGAALYFSREDPDESDEADIKKAVSQLSTQVERLQRDIATLEDRVDAQETSADTEPPQTEETSESQETEKTQPETSTIVDDEEDNEGPGINTIDIDDEF